MVFPGSTGFYRVLLGFPRFYWVSPGFTGFFALLSVLMDFFWTWTDLIWFHRVSLGFCGFYGFGYWVLPGFSGFYWVFLFFLGFDGPFWILIN